jgi:twitching motility protein PilT
VHQNKKSVTVHREVGDHTRSFGAALKGAMRHDPDIILVGEVRELETIKLALSCANMGMLVFGTLHTNNAPKPSTASSTPFPQKSKTRTG